jgi:hypothetical protein
MSRLLKKSVNWPYQVLAFLAILSINPIMLYKVYDFPGKLIFILIFIFIIISLRNKSLNSNDRPLAILFLMATLFSVLSVIHNDAIIMDNALQYLAIAVFVLYIVKILGILSFSNILIKAMAVLVVLNIFISIAITHGFLNFTDSFQIGGHNPRTVIGIANAVDSIIVGGLSYYRMAGIFDEPGQFSFVIWHIVILNRFTIKNSALEKILIYGGFVTMSLAHFVIYALYILFVGHLQGQARSYIKKIAYLIIGITTLGFLITIKDNTISDIFEKVLFSRVNTDFSSEHGLFTGARFKHTNSSFDIAMENPLVGTGLEGFKVVSANMMDIFANYGFFFGLVLLLPLVCLLLVASKRSFTHLASSVILFANYIQRPSVGQFITTVIVFILIYQMQARRRIVNSHSNRRKV